MVFFVGPLMSGENYKHKLGILRCGNAACNSGNQVSYLDLALDRGFIDAALPADGKPLILTTQNIDFVANRLTTFKCQDSACSNVVQGFSLAAPTNHFFGEGSVALDNFGRSRLYVNLRNQSDWTNIQHTLMSCTNSNCTSVVQKPITNIYSAGMSLVAKGTAGAPKMFNLNYLNSPSLYTLESRQCVDGRRCNDMTIGSIPTGLTGVHHWDAAQFNGNPAFAFFNFTDSTLYYRSCTDPYCSAFGPNVIIDASTPTKSVYGHNVNLLKQ